MAALATVVLAGCGSSGGAPVSTSTSAATTPDPSSPVASVVSTSSVAAPPTAVGLPTQSPSVVERHLARPAGARAVDFATCAAPAGVVLLYMKNQIFASGIRAVQLTQLPGLARLADQDHSAVAKARRTFLADGYPASFPIVHDLDAILAADAAVARDARATRLDAMPNDYVARSTADAQYGHDTRSPSICPT